MDGFPLETAVVPRASKGARPFGSWCARKKCVSALGNKKRATSLLDAQTTDL
jgi:hypothetical protein